MTSRRWLVAFLFVGVSTLLLAHHAEAQLFYFPLTPCRLADTRLPSGPYGGPALVGGTSRDFIITGVCGVPATAQAVAFNFTVVGATGSEGFLTVYPAGTPLPVASLMEFGPGESAVVLSNSANLALSVGGAISAFVADTGGTVHLIINVYGYFDPGS